MFDPENRKKRKDLGRKRLTAIKLLTNELLGSTLVHSLDILRLERPSILTSLEHARVVHSALKRVALPAKEIVSVRAIALGVAVAQRERVGSVLWPHVLELRGVPKCFVGDLTRS